MTKSLRKHISCGCKSEFDSRKCSLDLNRDKEKCQCECKHQVNHQKKNYLWNPSTCAREINKYLKSIADDLGITCDEIIDEVKKL